MQDICNEFIDLNFLCWMYDFKAKLSVAKFDYYVFY